jgi:hypothetical protein
MVCRREARDWKAGLVVVLLLHLHWRNLLVENYLGNNGPTIEMNPSGD